MYWLQHHLLSCPFKALFGFDCPGCGFQRSCLALLQGDVKNSLLLYPATVPILITGVYMLISIRYKFANGPVIKKALFLSVALIITVSYAVKMFMHFQPLHQFGM